MGRNKIIGERVKKYREANNLTRSQLGEKCGLNEEQITLIEEQSDIPSLSPLIKIARTLGVRLGTFLDDQIDLGPVICRQNEIQQSISFSNDNTESRKHMNYYSLSGNKTERQMEPFIVHLNQQTDDSVERSSHEGEEFAYVLSGKVEILYGDKQYYLEKGDSIYYDSIVPHLIRAVSNDGADLIAVIYTPL